MDRHCNDYNITIIMNRDQMVSQIADEVRKFVFDRCNEYNKNVSKDESVGMAAVLARAENDHTQAKRDYYSGEKRKRR